MVFVVEQLIKTNPASCNELDKDGLTPLHHAARGNFLRIIQSLLDAGAGETKNRDPSFFVIRLKKTFVSIIIFFRNEISWLPVNAWERNDD